MSLRSLDVVGVGNAIVDLTTEVRDVAISDLGLSKGSMNLIDEPRMQQILESVTVNALSAGGSAANTMVGVASFGGRSCFIGSVASDDLGANFVADIEKAKVRFVSAATLGRGERTGVSIVMVTPDAQRTMNTYLGAAPYFSDVAVEPEVINSSKMVFCEGYLWDKEVTKKSMKKIMESAKNSGARVAFSLSDSFCVERHRHDFLELLHGPVDILFANEDELKALYECEQERAVEKIREAGKLLCLTLGAKGSLLVFERERIEIPAEDPGKILDTTGAGDQYAAGVLYGIAQGFPLDVSGRLGSLAAAEVISHVGARPLKQLSSLL